jgi:hypothetical protein
VDFGDLPEHILWDVIIGPTAGFLIGVVLAALGRKFSPSHYVELHPQPPDLAAPSGNGDVTRVIYLTPAERFRVSTDSSREWLWPTLAVVGSVLIYLFLPWVLAVLAVLAIALAFFGCGSLSSSTRRGTDIYSGKRWLPWVMWAATFVSGVFLTAAFAVGELVRDDIPTHALSTFRVAAPVVVVWVTSVTVLVFVMQVAAADFGGQLLGGQANRGGPCALLGRALLAFGKSAINHPLPTTLFTMSVLLLIAAMSLGYMFMGFVRV